MGIDIRVSISPGFPRQPPCRTGVPFPLGTGSRSGRPHNIPAFITVPIMRLGNTSRPTTIADSQMGIMAITTAMRTTRQTTTARTIRDTARRDTKRDIRGILGSGTKTSFLLAGRIDRCVARGIVLRAACRTRGFGQLLSRSKQTRPARRHLMQGPLTLRRLLKPQPPAVHRQMKSSILVQARSLHLQAL
jgi:hypothetical protein